MKVKYYKFIGILNISALILTVCTLISYSTYSSDRLIITENDLVVNNDEEFTVIIDAGHGGIDPGAVGIDNVLEKDLNLLVANFVSEYLANKGVRVLMTRSEDKQLEIEGSRLSAKTQDLRARVDIANSHSNGILVSIHMNTFSDSSAQGLQVWYSANGKLSEILAQDIQTNVAKTVQPNNKRQIKKDPNSIYILRNSKIPAALVECGFLSNPDEVELLKDKKYQQELSKSIADGILIYLKEKIQDKLS